MDKYICKVCATIYDPETGDLEDRIKPGTKFEDLPADWGCSVCGSSKEKFEILSEEDYKRFKKISDDSNHFL